MSGCDCVLQLICASRYIGFYIGFHSFSVQCVPVSEYVQLRVGMALMV